MGNRTKHTGRIFPKENPPHINFTKTDASRKGSRIDRGFPAAMTKLKRLSFAGGSPSRLSQTQDGSTENLEQRLPARSFSVILNTTVKRRKPVRPHRESLLQPEVSSAWTPSLTVFHTQAPLTDFEVERVLRNGFGLLMLLKFFTTERIPIAEIILWQDSQMLWSAPKGIRFTLLAKITRKYFTKPSSPLFIQCPSELLPEFTNETASFDCVKPVLVQSLTQLQEYVMPRFRLSIYSDSYSRFVARASTPAQLDDFEKLRCIGRGGFGKVHAVTKRDTGQLYAMKTLSKAQVVKRSMTEFVLREQMMLAKLESAFIVNLLYSFQDRDCLYMCMDMMIGGDLKYQLGVLGRMPENMVRFYAIELAYGIQYLHDRGYVHRDIKPQNIMFDQDGHMRLTDMGLAMECNQNQTVNGRSGTVGYMSPEVVKLKQGSHSLDWWALGVVLYEMAFGTHPFPGATKVSL
eukprot:c11326_g1_i3.p1 GENE.c11326_g1_i3~~c11326_g1_i3.p1  ORF type:complete len:461 (-),score=88.04 c11326_g1_i3:63-1445(-)